MGMWKKIAPTEAVMEKFRKNRAPKERTGEFYQKEFPTTTQTIERAPGYGDRYERRVQKRKDKKRAKKAMKGGK